MSAEPTDQPQPSEPHIRVLKGNPPTPNWPRSSRCWAASAARPPPAPEPTRWGLPVDKLRYPVFSWQKITLQEMIHMRQ